MVPRAVLMKTGLKPFNTARTVNTAHPKSIVFSAKPIPRFSKTAQSTVRRPFQTKIAVSNKRFTHKVNTAKAQAVNTARPQAVNAARPQAVNTARPKIVKTARPNSAVVNAVRVNQENAVHIINESEDVDNGKPKSAADDQNPTLEATHVEFFSDEDEPEVNLGNITNSYTVPTTPNTRIHKDHPIENMIGDVKSSVQTRRMTKPTSE
ncbi:hypothetical protein Tco_0331101 [Tanacetum coccineum]